MKKEWFKYGLLTIIGIMVYNITKAGSVANKFIKFSSAEALKLLSLQNALKSVGFNQPQIDFALAQLLYETGRFTSASTVAVENNNYSGIKWLNKPYQNATKGTLVPAGERPADPNSPLNYYAKFSNMEAWANDYKRILSLVRSHLGSPITAPTIEDFVDRLAANGYFDVRGKAAYLRGLKKYLAMFQN